MSEPAAEPVARPPGPSTEATRGPSAWFVPWAARLVVLVLTSLPTWLAARALLLAGPARAPWYVDAGRPLPAVQLLALLGELGPGLAGAMTASIALAYLGQLGVTGGALAVFDPRREVGVTRAFFAGTTRHLGPFLRVSLLALVLLAAGGWLLGRGLGAIGDWALGDDATLDAQAIVWPGVTSAATWLWACLVGAFALHARTLVVVRRERAVRRVLLPVLRLWWRRPWVGPVLYVAFAALGTGLGGLAWIGWRQSAGATVWVLASTLGLALQSAAWLAVVAVAVHAASALDPVTGETR